MRILYLNHNTAGVGTWQRASNLGRALALRGHQLTMVTTHPRRRFGFETVTLGSYTEVHSPDLFRGVARSGWDPTNAARRISFLRRHSFDLIHAFDARPVVILPALWMARRTGSPLFLDWADWWGRGGRIEERSGWWVRTFFGPVETWFEETFRTRAEGTTTISRALAQRARDLGVESQRIWILPNGCDPERIRPGSRDEARRALGIPSGPPLVLHVGVLTPADMAQLKTAFQRVVAEESGSRLVLVGNHTAPLPLELARSPAVSTVGFVASEVLREWLSAADVCVIPLVDTPNNRGRWPGRINDYLSAGRATVMPAVGDAATLIEKHGAGWTCAPEPEALAQSLLRALRDREACRRAGERARALAVGELAWGVLAERLEAAYNAILARRSGEPRPGSRASFAGQGQAAGTNGQNSGLSHL